MAISVDRVIALVWLLEYMNFKRRYGITIICCAFLPALAATLLLGVNLWISQVATWVQWDLCIRTSLKITLLLSCREVVLIKRLLKLEIRSIAISKVGSNREDILIKGLDAKKFSWINSVCFHIKNAPKLATIKSSSEQAGIEKNLNVLIFSFLIHWFICSLFHNFRWYFTFPDLYHDVLYWQRF